ncbi:hypothetical protein HB816_08690 [Listeria booriae]|uniref:hypothetical protein n=1 Tax=Listeria booriae TaxID=1552123 RepID=UPI00162A74F7|nr:hypothetical protein [Listeria booriae]MBC1230519.1 hypothetical protein [Listeria booriae]
MTQSQNEKDRELLYLCRARFETTLLEDFEQKALLKLANRLFTERENAETVYKFSGKVPNMFSLGESQIIWGDVDSTNMKVPVEEGQQGVWIPVGD